MQTRKQIKDEYWKIRGTAEVEYWKIKETAYAKYWKIKETAWSERNRKLKELYKEINNNKK